MQNLIVSRGVMARQGKKRLHALEKGKSKTTKSRRQRKAERDPDAPKLIPRTIENSKRVDPSIAEATPEEMTLEDATDAFANFFTQAASTDSTELSSVQPKILITSTRRSHPKTFHFAEELVDLFPGAEFRRRDAEHLIKDVVAGAIQRNYTHLIVVNESRKQPDTLSLIRLPEGPTFLFQLSSIRLGKEIQGHGRSSCHTPELVLNNFTTRLGHLVGRLFVTLFPPIPQFRGRQVVTFHNQRDFIFVRRHRYIFEGERRVRTQEIGPQFTLKLRAIYKSLCEFQTAPVEWQWKAHAGAEQKGLFAL